MNRQEIVDFRNIMRSYPGMSMILLPNTPDFTIIEASDKLLQVTGSARLDIIGKNLFDVFPDNPLDVMASGVNNMGISLEKVLATRMPDKMNIQRYDVKNASGNFVEFYWAPANTPVINDDGKVEYIIHTIENITEKILSESEAKANKDISDINNLLNLQAYNLFMQAPVGFSLLTGNDNIISLANSFGLLLTGKGEEIIGKPISEVFPEVQSQGYIDLINEVKSNGRSIDMKETPVTLIINGEEQTLYLNLIYQPFYQSGLVAGVLSISTDVTEQVLARRESEELRERFETMANNIPNLAWIANADGWIFWYNNRWYEYTGTTPKEMEGWGWKSVHDPEKLSSVLELWQQSIDNGLPFEMVFPLLGADKIYRPFLTRVIPIKNNEGKIIRWIGTNTDITKQKEVERMKDDFLSIASHELRTPLTTIKAYGQIAEGLLENNGDTQTLGMVKKMGLQVNKLTNLIGNLLDITRIQQGKLIYTESFFNLNDFIREEIDDIQRTSVSHTIVQHLDESAQIFGDREKLSQVLNNLISNAIKYSPNASIIQVSTLLQEDGIQLSVKDHGIGISIQEQQNVFQQFYRVNENSTFPGLGIGLFICKEIISRHHGRIWLESNIGEGSTFYFWIPYNHSILP